MTVSRPQSDPGAASRPPGQTQTSAAPSTQNAPMTSAPVGPEQATVGRQNSQAFVRAVSPVNETRDLLGAEQAMNSAPLMTSLALPVGAKDVAPSTTQELQAHIIAYLQQRFPQNVQTRATSQSGGVVVGAGTATEGQQGLATETSWGVADESLGTNTAAQATMEDASKQPEMDQTNGSVRYAHVVDSQNESLFGAGGPSQDDVQQRDDGTETSGDCPVMSAMAAIADQDPSAIQNMFERVDDHTYNVTLYYRGTPETYTVDDTVPVDASGKPTGAQLTIDPVSNKAIIWPSLVEKAYAKLQDVHPGVLPWSGLSGYRDLNEGGTGADALATLTGRQVYSTDPRSAGSQEVEGLLNLSNQGVPLTVMTGLTDNGGMLPSGLQPNHIYSVVSTWQDSSGRQMTLLRNPWGEDPSQDSQDEPGFVSVLTQSIESDCRGINAGNVLAD